MQATVTTRQFPFGRFNAMAAKVAVAAGLAAAVATGATMSLDDTLESGHTARTAAPQAHYVEWAGEGRLAPESAGITQLQAHPAELAGEGIVGGLGVAQPRLQAHFEPGAGEGLVGSGLRLPADAVKSYFVPQAGEGLVGGYGELQEIELNVGHVAIGAGEGWVANGRPVESAIKAIYNPNMGEGIIAGYGEAVRD